VNLEDMTCRDCGAAPGRDCVVVENHGPFGFMIRGVPPHQARREDHERMTTEMWRLDG
jgi:hypothetical protein